MTYCKPQLTIAGDEEGHPRRPCSELARGTRRGVGSTLTNRLRMAAIVAALPTSLSALPQAPDTAATNEVEIAISGNASWRSSFSAMADARLGYTRSLPEYEFRVSVRGSYGKSDEVVTAKDWRAEVGFDATPDDDLSLFALADVERDSVRKLAVRAKMGLGFKRVLMGKREENKTSISVAVLGAFEKHADAKNSNETTGRLSVRLKSDMKISEKIDLKAVWFWQPRVDAFSDILVRGNVTLGLFQLTKGVKLTLTYDDFYDSRPPKGVNKSDRRLLFGVQGKL